MQVFLDLLYFLSIPAVILLIFIATHRGAANHYRIVRVTNTLGEEKFEVYFQYESMDCVNRNWRLEETFDTAQLADEFIARQFTIRETVREGKLTK